MYEHTLVGSAYTIHVRMEVRSHTGRGYYQGDHYANGYFYDYTTSYGSGEVTVRMPTGEVVAVCGLIYSETDAGGRSREVSDSAFKHCVEVRDLLPERQEAYADWFAEKVIKYFRTPTQGGGMPRITLNELDRTELIRCGFLPSPAGQISLPLEDVRIPTNA